MRLRERARELPRASWVRLGLLVGALAVLGVAVLVTGVPSVGAARAWVAELGAVAPLVFLLGFVALTATPFPKSVLVVVAGALWGMWLGLAICTVAVVLGASVGFVIGRRWIRDSVRLLVGPRMKDVDDAVRRSFVAVLAIRVMPVLPFTLLNYAFGITSIGYPRFALSTAIGCLPGTAAYVAVGALGADLTSWQFWAALGAIATMSLIGVAVSARRRGRVTQSEHARD